METDDWIPPVPSLTYKPPVPSLTYKPPAPSLIHNHNTQLQSNLPTAERALERDHELARDTRPSYNRPIGIEQTLYLCTICETPTKFDDYHKLSKHVERFHSAFNQDNKGVKRAKGEHEESWPKKLRWE